MREERTASRRMNGRTRICGLGKVLARLARRPRVRSASPKEEIKVVSHRIGGGNELGINTQNPLVVRRIRPGELLEKLLGSIDRISVNKNAHYFHFIPQVQITQSLICTCGLNTRFIKQFIDYGTIFSYWYSI